MSHKSNRPCKGCLAGIGDAEKGLFEMMGPSKHASNAGMSSNKSCLDG